MITRALFTFRNKEGKENKKEETYNGEIKTIKQLKERAYRWVKEREFPRGKRTASDFVFQEHSRMITFEYGWLFIDVWCDK
jgi:hypothetical protein